ncbi:uncharacterized protein LOC116187646 [Punica granatum]|uniref:Uncharacterized protein LOC116187646 n=2 Tax=Punica granatum TaxID=22663 RepID=A0A6P8BNS2_PUNGR|nr:uncharacterized protein LOC116187646 [Punica granatum]
MSEDQLWNNRRLDDPVQRFVDYVIVVIKESVKTITYESVNSIVRVINGVSALLLAILPEKSSILEGMHGWELRPRVRGPRFPRWMENGVSSFNLFVHELSVDPDDSSCEDLSSDEEDGDEHDYPPSPLSQISHVSRASSLSRNNRQRMCWITLMFSWILLPAELLSSVLFQLSDFYYPSQPGTSPAAGNEISSLTNSANKVYALKDLIIHRTTDRRRGVIEDLHLATEIFIESLFDSVHKAAHYILSPLEAISLIWRWIFLSEGSTGDDAYYDSSADVSVPTDIIGDHDLTPSECNTPFQHTILNTDARTCQDVITELGYPYEAIHVVTADGYILLLERIPRRDARKAVYLQHGILDSSMGWVSNGVVGSPAFAAYDKGYDVFLGNFRGLVSREHVNKNISSQQYWNYSVNEHGTQDIPAMIEKIYEVKTCELNLLNPSDNMDKEIDSDQPFKLCTICHSLGGAAMLMYVITRRIEEKPHRLSRLILLSPAGFHDDSNLTFIAAENFFMLFTPLLSPLIPAFYIPTRFFRMLLNKLARDFHDYPALGGLVQTIMSYLIGGDSSNWVGVMGLPHYNMNDMPGLSFRVAHHLAQMKRARKFRMYDYGSPYLNMEIYGDLKPLDLGEYFSFIDVPVDLVAGRKDEVIKPTMVRKHYKLMKASAVDVSYREFEYAHLDFTFSHREELLDYVMSRLRLIEPIPKQQISQKSRSKRRRSVLDS